MSGTTPNIGLNVPDYGDQNWDVPVNQNWNTLDTAIAGKQATLTFDSTPTSGSSNPVTSDGIHSAIQAATPAVDNKSVDYNGSSQLEAIGVIDRKDSSTAVKTWTGTRAQYDAIVSKDPNTLYNTDNGLFLGTTQVANLSSVRNIGEIIQSTIPLSDTGLHLLDGSLISGSGSYSAFVTYIAGLVSSYPDLFETETAWQQAVTDYGVCGKFVYDSTNNTVRLPKITGFTEGTTDVTALGDLVEAGLPNIIGTLATPYLRNNPASDYFSGAFVGGADVGTCCNGGSGKNQKSTFDASRSSAIYGNSSTVQPQSIKVLYYIVIATSTKTSIEVDIDEVMTDLNGKADVDLSNCTKPHIVETYVNGTSWYRIYSDGWCEQGGVETSTSTTFLVPFADTNYFVAALAVTTASTSQTNRATNVTGKTTTGFTTYVVQNRNWFACGYKS